MLTDPLNGLDMPNRDGWAAQDAWAQRHGLRPSRAKECPRVVAGKRCLYGFNGSCICGWLRNEARGEHGRVYDHARIWANDRGGHVLTVEPYACTPAMVEALAESLRPLGLRVEASGEDSPWYPKRTTLIVVTKAPDESAAVQWTGENERELAEFTSDGFIALRDDVRGNPPKGAAVLLDTVMHAWVTVLAGEWVVRGRGGLFYASASRDPGGAMIGHALLGDVA